MKEPKDKWNILSPDEKLKMREKIKVVMKNQEMTWVKLGNLTSLDQSNLKVSIERSAAHLDKFMGLLGYEVEFKKKN